MSGDHLVFEQGSRQWDPDLDVVKFVGFAHGRRHDFFLGRGELAAMAELAADGRADALLAGFDDFHARIIAAAHYAWASDGGSSDGYVITEEDIAAVAA